MVEKLANSILELSLFRGSRVWSRTSATVMIDNNRWYSKKETMKIHEYKIPLVTGLSENSATSHYLIMLPPSSQVSSLISPGCYRPNRSSKAEYAECTAANPYPCPTETAYHSSCQPTKPTPFKTMSGNAWFQLRLVARKKNISSKTQKHKNENKNFL